MAISQTQLPGIFRRGVQETFSDRVMPKPLFLSMAGETETTAKFVSVEVRRYNESVAVDIERGANSRRNQFDRSTFRTYMPPYYNEGFDITELDVYDRVFGQGEVSESAVADLVDAASEKAGILTDKIRRAQEIQWSQVFQTGTVQLVNGDNIDYRRKAGSIVDVGAVRYWDQAGARILEDLENGANFLRSTGKSTVMEINAVMGATAFAALLRSSEILNLGDQTFVKRVDVIMPSNPMNGAIYHGTLSAGSYLVHVFTYPETYEDATGTTQKYWPDNLVLMTPKEGYRFTTKYAGIPAIMKGNNALPQYIGQLKAQYYMNNYIDDRNSKHVFEVRSAPLSVPVSVDQMYTIQVLA